MKIAAIYNVFDGEELLPGSIRQIIDHVGAVIIVYQNISNYGEYYDPYFGDPIFTDSKVTFVSFTPKEMNGGTNERLKRNLGLKIAKTFCCTHFLHMDCDEYYQDFGEAVKVFLNTGCAGSVCKLRTYFKKPTLQLERPEGYFVPFIHELRDNTEAGGNLYPFYVDPTRRINQQDVVELPIFMHHFSWVRKDIDRKVRNSTARGNIQKKTYLRDYHMDLKDGDFVECYQMKVREVEDIFNINTAL
jgi:hypothetical protein